MKAIKYIPVFAIFTLFMACTTAQISTALKTASEVLTESDDPSTSEVSAGLREALINGVSNGVDLTSKLDGYFKNPEIKLPFPPEIVQVETKLRQLGLNKPVDDFILSINRAAEKAAVEAKPIFIGAIKTMTVSDAWALLKGNETAATDYLKKNTTDDLQAKFQPVIKNSLDNADATKYYNDMIGIYNKVPFVKKVETDLPEYVTGLAMDGLFLLVAREEAKIRKDPIARTSELLKKVFGYKAQ